MDLWLDRAAARRGFEAASGTNVLAREVEPRLLERMDYIKLDPARIVDAGCGTGSGVLLLRARYPDAQILGIDYSLEALRNARAPGNWLERVRGLFQSRQEHWLASDMGRLPLANASCDLVWSNLSLAWAADPIVCIKEWLRVLRVGGLLMFTTYGPDTLKELRTAFAAEDEAPHVHPFVDLHDLGDILVASGFAEPVMDMEMLTLTYADVPAVLADLRATGQINAHSRRRRSLTGRERWRRMIERYKAAPGSGRIPATFEIVYGHAWKPEPRKVADGREIISFKPWGGRGS
jgi:malonyl-CoA O-methyltransferase